jgi:hypothetical protein
MGDAKIAVTDVATTVATILANADIVASAIRAIADFLSWL